MTAFPTLWDAGFVWGPSDTDEPAAVWGPSPYVATSGRPSINAAIAGKNVLTQCRSASWTVGRTGWFSTLQPAQASLSFVGPVDAAPNDPIVIFSEAGVLWSGRVDGVTLSRDVSGHYFSNITAMDFVGVLGQATLTEASIPSGTIIDQVKWVAGQAGLTLVVEEVPTLGTLPTLASSTFTGSVLQYINNAEQSSNALLFLRPDGTFSVMLREAIADTEVTAIPTVDFDSPASWHTSLAVTDVINSWQLVKADGTVVLNTTDSPSAEAYGLRAYSVNDFLVSTATHFSSGLRTAMAVPRYVLDSADFHIQDVGQGMLTVRPLDYIDHEGDLWQVMSVRHSVDLSTWRVTISADQSQNSIVGGTNPDPEPEPEPGTHTEQETIIGTKDSTLFKSSGGGEYGSGQDPYIPVGRWQGNIMRGLVQFNLTKPTGYVKVQKAVLRLRTSNQTRVAFGSNPKIYVRRVTSSWNEGTVTYPYAFNNAVVWPGPSKTSDDQVLKNVTKSTNTDVDIVVTDMVRRMVNGTNNGIMLQSANEGSNSNTTEFHSSDGSREPRLIVTWLVQD